MVTILNNLVYDGSIGKYGLLDLYIPDKSDNNGTMIIYIHGGGLESGDKSDESDIYGELAMLGYTVASPNYRMYPDAAFPDYITDCANAISWIFSNAGHYSKYERVFVGGISAGAFISMMLHFDKKYLSDVGVDESEICGYIFDAGQPTVHFNVLRERGENPALVRVDETCAIYHVTGENPVNNGRKFYILVSDNDIPGRKEQNELLIRTMINHGYDENCIKYQVIKGYPHAGYVHDLKGKRHTQTNNLHGYTELIDGFVRS